MEGFISPNGTHEIDIDSKVDNPSFEVHMATLWILLKKGAQVGINMGFRGSNGQVDFENKINAKIHLRPDVILAAMPDACRILDQQINYGRGVRVSLAPADEQSVHKAQVREIQRELERDTMGSGERARNQSRRQRETQEPSKSRSRAHD